MNMVAVDAGDQVDFWHTLSHTHGMATAAGDASFWELPKHKRFRMLDEVTLEDRRYRATRDSSAFGSGCCHAVLAESTPLAVSLCRLSARAAVPCPGICPLCIHLPAPDEVQRRTCRTLSAPPHARLHPSIVQAHRAISICPASPVPPCCQLPPTPSHTTTAHSLP